MDTVTKIEIDAAKIASKRVFQKTAETTGDLIENKMADEISSIGKPKEKDKMYIPSEKRQQIIDDFRLSWMQFHGLALLNKNGIWKNCKFSQHKKGFITKKWIKVYDQSKGSYSVNKEIRIKTPMLRSDLCDYSDAYIDQIQITNDCSK